MNTLKPNFFENSNNFLNEKFVCYFEKLYVVTCFLKQQQET